MLRKKVCGRKRRLPLQLSLGLSEDVPEADGKMYFVHPRVSWSEISYPGNGVGFGVRCGKQNAPFAFVERRIGLVAFCGLLNWSYSLENGRARSA